MNRRQKIIISVTGIFLVLLILVGLTYAFFLTRIKGNENPTSISVTTANLVVEYTDGDSNGDGVADAYMAFEKIQPSDTITYTKVFNVENKGNDTASYSVILDEMTNEFERNQDLQYTLTRSGETDPVASGYLAVGTHQVILGKVDIDVEDVHTYTLTLKYDEAGIDQSVDMNKTLSFKVDIDNERVTWDTATEGTLLYAIKNASDVSTTMSSLEDDYGLSHYYKGDVSNNFVNYSGMCWRIVRVQGDGTIKMALLFNDVCENFSSATVEEKDVSQSFINMNEKDYGSLNYAESNLPGAVSSWITSSKLDTSKLVKTDFCNDTSIEKINVSYYDDNWMDATPEDATLFWYEKDYGSNVRKENNSYTLKCNMKGLENTSANRIFTEVALLTEDEYMLGGSYLIDKDLGAGEGAGYADWTMSPDYMLVEDYVSRGEVITTEQRVYVANNYGGELITLTGMYARPVINVKSDVILDKNISEQNGTESKPYQIG